MEAAAGRLLFVCISELRPVMQKAGGWCLHWLTAMRMRAACSYFALGLHHHGARLRISAAGVHRSKIVAVR